MIEGEHSMWVLSLSTSNEMSNRLLGSESKMEEALRWRVRLKKLVREAVKFVHRRFKWRHYRVTHEGSAGKRKQGQEEMMNKVESSDH